MQLRELGGAASICALVFLAGACSNRERRPIVGNYCLNNIMEGYDFTIVGCGWFPALRGKTDNGPMDGSIAELGWDSRFIVARRNPVFVSDQAGWMILDTKKETLSTAYSDEAWQRRRQDPDVSNIQIYLANEAWKRLERR